MSKSERHRKQSLLSATCIKDMQHHELTEKLVTKYYPDDPQNIEDFFEHEYANGFDNYNVEGYKYR